MLDESAEPAHALLGVRGGRTGELRVDAVDMQIDGVRAGEQKGCRSQSREHEAKRHGRDVVTERID